MSQDQISLNGGRESIVTNSSPQFGTYLSAQYVEAKRLTPTPTEWRANGRPIYDRLPSASERYKVNFSYDNNLAYTFIPRGEGLTGPTSMSVQAAGDNKFLTIKGGKIVWEYGMITTDPVIIDLELVGIGSARYLIAYQLYYDDAPIQAQYSVTGVPISGFTLDIQSNTDDVLGWRYTPQLAFGGTNRFWSNYDGLFPSYNQAALLSWQTDLPCSFSEILLRCPSNTAYTGTATLSYMVCPDANEGFCKNPEWVFEQTVSVSEDSTGQFFKFTTENPCFCKGWRVEWSDSSVSISDVFVTGTITQLKRPATAYTNYGLVAYPANSIPTKFTNSLGEEIPLILCKLAYVDVSSAYIVERVQDIREIVNTSYEPISDWLTRAWDTNLISLYEQCTDYPKAWMAPTTCMELEYDKLLQYGVEVSYSKCPSPSYQEY